MHHHDFKNLIVIFVLLILSPISGYGQNNDLKINELEYLDKPGLSVLVFHDDYPEGHQGGITIIQHGARVATNGDVRLEPTPGQWQPVPKVGKRSVSMKDSKISVPCSYPNPDKNRKGFNPIIYPNLNLDYTVNVQANGQAFIITIDLKNPLPDKWVGKVGFNLELFPGDLFGKTYSMDSEVGFFPRQLNGPMIKDQVNGVINEPLAEGSHLVIVPENEIQRMSIKSEKGNLQLLDGRDFHNNGWFVVRTPIPAGETSGAIVWTVTPHVKASWRYEPVIHVSQVGYFPQLKKIAVIETDTHHKNDTKVFLKKILPDGSRKIVLSRTPHEWGKFYRYQYYQFDFSEIHEPGMYSITYGEQQSNPFLIGQDVFDRHVWQPTLEYFLPVQMCHMRVNDRYRVWHGLCHMDDALMAPTDTLHFDGYHQGGSTLTHFKSYDHVPGLNVGGWHDAGDYDLRVESQATTVRVLSLIYEMFNVDYDNTTIDQKNRLVEMHLPDGRPDILQQIEHGVLSILGGYKSLGRLYRGIICSDLRQYVLLGDGSTMTDNVICTSPDAAKQADDRWVFTEDNPRRELQVAAGLAAAYRVLKDYDELLANECLKTAEDIFSMHEDNDKAAPFKFDPLVELLISTNKGVYRDSLLSLKSGINERMLMFISGTLARAIPVVNDEKFTKVISENLKSNNQALEKMCEENPFGIPYRPRIWGAGWDLQHFGVSQYFLHKQFPDIVSNEYLLNVLNFILGCHPGQNTASFVSGVGSKSVEVAYGTNRADWSYIPGGVVSGTGLIRPDFFELKEWPFFWQQTEYMVNGAASNFMFLVLAARDVMAEK